MPKKLEDEIKQLDKNIRTEIDKIHDNKKGNISIQKKPISKTNKEVILLYNEDVEKAKKLENTRKNGRNDYPVRTMLNLIYAMISYLYITL